MRALFRRIQPPDRDPMLDFDERERVVAHLRPLVEAGGGRSRQAGLHLFAVKDGR